MRVIAGIYRSRILKSPKTLALRPTSDMLRETLFDVLGPAIAGSRFIDVYAGTGAVGIEALSRGAAEVVFIEKHGPTAGLIRQNLQMLGARDGVQVLPIDALRGLEKIATKHTPGGPGFDFVYVDPPYAEEEEYARVLDFLGGAAFLAPWAVIIAEHRREAKLPEQIGNLARTRVLRQGDASLSFFRRHGTSQP